MSQDSNNSFLDHLRESQTESLIADEDNNTLSITTNQSNEDVMENPLQEGAIPPEARRALVNLLRQGVILSSQKTKLFEVVCRYQSVISNHLADMYLKLILDEKAGVAFVAQIDESDNSHNDNEEIISLISRRTLSLYETLLLLILRKHYQERESTGEQRIIIDIERIDANLTPFMPLTNSSKSDHRKLNAALQKMVEKRILSAVRGSEDRFEITPIIRYVVNAAFLENMLAEYQRLGEQTQ